MLGECLHQQPFLLWRFLAIFAILFVQNLIYIQYEGISVYQPRSRYYFED